MTSWGENSVAALEALSDALGARPSDAKPQALVELNKPTGALTIRHDRPGDRVRDPGKRHHGR